MSDYLNWLKRNMDEVEQFNGRYRTINGIFNSVPIYFGWHFNVFMSKPKFRLRIAQPLEYFDRWANSEFCIIDDVESVFNNTKEFQKGLIMMTLLSKQLGADGFCNFDNGVTNIIQWIQDNEIQISNIKEEDKFMFYMHFRKDM